MSARAFGQGHDVAPAIWDRTAGTSSHTGVVGDVVSFVVTVVVVFW